MPTTTDTLTPPITPTFTVRTKRIESGRTDPFVVSTALVSGALDFKRFVGDDSRPFSLVNIHHVVGITTTVETQDDGRQVTVIKVIQANGEPLTVHAFHDGPAPA